MKNKEEQKQHLIDIMRGDEELGIYWEGVEKSNYIMSIDPHDKQETLEKAKDLAYWRANAEEDYIKVPISVLRYINELENRMYTEEDMRKAYFSAIESTGEGWNGEYANGNNPNIEENFDNEFQEWFEQFKKK